MNVREYVITQLKDYREMKQNVHILQFELDALPIDNNFGCNELIESMTFAHATEENVQCSRISDKTSSIALNYRAVNFKQMQETRKRIEEQLSMYRLQVTRLETYLAALLEAEAEILRQYYFDGITWQEIAQRSNVCLRSIVRRRDHALCQLERYYYRLAELGVLPDVQTGQGGQI